MSSKNSRDGNKPVFHLAELSNGVQEMVLSNAEL